ncbi:hypothetical protein GO755_25385 [Spirosoma sp. HMF4905]|uniref:Uncharacterized protein n=1 Tax=Spirosoma arboris TaxID=2682092 RepID=A0A7K1SHU3_9BACT|nr:hypothetical protein [Spirosoma arboris]MVM33397.1 hypothetical protein [Spirosoma arboris]
MHSVLAVMRRMACLLTILIVPQCSPETSQASQVTSDRSLAGKTFAVSLDGPAAVRFKDTAIRLVLLRNHRGQFWVSKQGISEQMTIGWQVNNDSLTLERIDSAKSEKRFPAQRFAVVKRGNVYQLASRWERMYLTELN